MQNLLKTMIVTDGLGHSAALRALPRFARSLNSEYAVRLRSPKPFATLRASHTRRTLYSIKPGTNHKKIIYLTNFLLKIWLQLANISR